MLEQLWKHEVTFHECRGIHLLGQVNYHAVTINKCHRKGFIVARLSCIARPLFGIQL